MEPGRADQQRRGPRLPGEAALDGLEERDALLRGLHAPHGRQQHGRDEGHAADPQHDAEDVQGASNDGWIHLGTAGLGREGGIVIQYGINLRPPTGE